MKHRKHEDLADLDPKFRDHPLLGSTWDKEGGHLVGACFFCGRLRTGRMANSLPRPEDIPPRKPILGGAWPCPRFTKPIHGGRVRFALRCYACLPKHEWVDECGRCRFPHRQTRLVRISDGKPYEPPPLTESEKDDKNALLNRLFVSELEAIPEEVPASERVRHCLRCGLDERRILHRSSGRYGIDREFCTVAKIGKCRGCGRDGVGISTESYEELCGTCLYPMTEVYHSAREAVGAMVAIDKGEIPEKPSKPPKAS